MNDPVFQATKEMDFSYIEKAPLWNMQRQHYHDGYEIYLQIEGTREIFFQYKKYLLPPGAVCIITPHILHATKNRNDDELYSRYLFNFTSKIFNEFLSDIETKAFLKELFPCIIHLNGEQLSMFMQHINNIYDYWDMHLHNIARGKKLAYIEVYRILDHLVRIIKASPEMLKLSDLVIASDSPIYDVLFYIEQNYYKDVQIEDIIRLSHMSKSSFYRSFKQITGDSFNHYLNNFRVIKAHKLISDSRFSLHKIAEITGFSSTAHMTRIFKEIHGISPSEYRHTLL